MILSQHNVRNMDCPCHSRKTYSTCCEPFHLGSLPKKPVELMRSRYAAYALGLAGYIIDTKHPSHPYYNENHILWKKDLLFFSDNTQFDGLEILEQSTSGDNGTVTFRAILSSKGRDISHTERSTFVREKGEWFYQNGEHNC